MERLRSFQTPSLWLAIVAVFVCSATVFAASASVPQQTAPNNAAVLQSMSTMPLAFTQNMGQWPDSILYRANAGGATMWFTPNGAYYQFTRRIARANATVTTSDVSASTLQPQHELDSLETTLIKASFVGGNPNAKLIGSEQLAYRCNYFLGNDPVKWRTDVPNYTSVTYANVYPGIDLKYYGDGSKMEYDFIVPPGADYSQIHIQYTGATSLAVNANGDLIIETAWGKVTEHAPLVYQTDGANRTTIQSAYCITGDHTFSFTLGNEYNPALAVVIDPVLTYSTYLGGSSNEYGTGITVDKAGSAYVTGYSQSTNFPTLSAFDSSHGGWDDVFVTKLSPAGNSLVYSTYLGSTGTDFGFGITVDTSGCAYVTGKTDSPDFPTVNPYRTINTHGFADAFVTKLSPAGDSLVYSTYLGGDNIDNGLSIAVDMAGCAYVTGNTQSSDFSTVTPFDGNLNGVIDAFVTKLNPAGNSLAYSTYLGGSAADVGISIAIDLAGNAYVTGFTNSPDFPTLTPFQGTFKGWYDVFVTKLNPAGNNLAYSTYLGGSLDDQGNGITVDSAGSAYIIGMTLSPDFPTANAFDGSFAGGLYDYDAFITKLSPAGDSLAYSTYLGGSLNDQGFGIAVDGAGSAYVIGTTYSTDFPTATPYDGSINGVKDVFLTKFNPAGNNVDYSTYLGGNSIEYVGAVTLDTTGAIYVTGSTVSSNFPIVNPFDASSNGGRDVFVLKITMPSTKCIGLTGNVDCDDKDQVDISDLTALVDNLYISMLPLCNTKEANVDGSEDGNIDISDLTALVDYLYISFTPPKPCL